MKNPRMFSTIGALCFSFYAIQTWGQPSMLDPTFNIGSGANGVVNSAAVQTDGKVILGGEFTTVNGIARTYVARLNDDGSLDNGFKVPGSGLDSWVRCVVMQNDGRVLISGNFTRAHGYPRKGIARLNSDGSVDAAFNPGSGLNGDVEAILIQKNGKIIIGGSFGSYNGEMRKNLARLNPDGSLDLGFNNGDGPDARVICIASGPDDKLVVGGEFRSYDGQASKYLVSLSPDGIPDFEFTLGKAVDDTVIAIAIQPDGKILIGGSFRNVQGFPRGGIARLNPDGTIDAEFETGSGVDGGSRQVYSLVLQKDGKVLIAGNFYHINDLEHRWLARLTPNGMPEDSFNPILSFSGDSYRTINPLPNDRIIVYGRFTAINGVPCNHIARLNPSWMTAPNVMPNGQCQLTLTVATDRHLALQATTDLVDWTTISDFISTNDVLRVVDPDAAKYPHRFYRVVQMP